MRQLIPEVANRITEDLKAVGSDGGIFRVEEAQPGEEERPRWQVNVPAWLLLSVVTGGFVITSKCACAAIAAAAFASLISALPTGSLLAAASALHPCPLALAAASDVACPAAGVVLAGPEGLEV